MIMGVMAASQTGIAPDVAKTLAICRNKINVKAKAIPMAKFFPIPCRLFCEDKARPMSVNMTAVRGCRKR